MKYFGVLLLAFTLAFPLTGATQSMAPVSEQKSSGGESFAPPTSRDILQSYIMLDGVDIKDPKKADDYARLMYCGLYEEKFASDFEWNTIRNQLIDRIKQKKEYFRTQYEISGIIYLGRYNFETQDFPLVEKSSLFNVSSLVLIDDQGITTQGACMSKYQNSFPRSYVVKLKQALTVDRLKVPLDEAEKLLARMEKVKNKDRRLYIRFRVRVSSAAPSGRGSTYGSFVGDVTAIDVFYDKERTRYFGRIPIE